MKKYLKIGLIIFCLIGVIIVAKGIITSDNAELILNEKIYPILVGIIGAITSIYTVLKPIILKLNISSDDFEKNLNYSKKLVNENEEFKKEILALYKKIETLNKNVGNLKKIMLTVTANTQELVKNGTASIIAKEGNYEN